MATQAQFEAALAAKWDCSKAEAREALDDIAELVFQELKANPDEAVVIRGLGRFKINARAARMGRNPATGEQMKIKASKKLKVLPNKALRDQLKVK